MRGVLNAEGYFALACLVILLVRGRWGEPVDLGWRGRWWMLLLAPLPFLLYLSFPFLADDYAHILHARALTAAGVPALFTVPAADHFFRPLGYLSYAVDARWAGLSPAALASERAGAAYGEYAAGISALPGAAVPFPDLRSGGDAVCDTWIATGSGDLGFGAIRLAGGAFQPGGADLLLTREGMDSGALPFRGGAEQGERLRCTSACGSGALVRAAGSGSEYRAACLEWRRLCLSTGGRCWAGWADIEMP